MCEESCSHNLIRVSRRKMNKGQEGDIIDMVLGKGQGNNNEDPMKRFGMDVDVEGGVDGGGFQLAGNQTSKYYWVLSKFRQCCEHFVHLI